MRFQTSASQAHCRRRCERRTVEPCTSTSRRRRWAGSSAGRVRFAHDPRRRARGGTDRRRVPHSEGRALRAAGDHVEAEWPTASDRQLEQLIDDVIATNEKGMRCLDGQRRPTKAIVKGQLGTLPRPDTHAPGVDVSAVHALPAPPTRPLPSSSLRLACSRRPPNPSGRGGTLGGQSTVAWWRRRRPRRRPNRVAALRRPAVEPVIRPSAYGASRGRGRHAGWRRHRAADGPFPRRRSGRRSDRRRHRRVPGRYTSGWKERESAGVAGPASSASGAAGGR